METMGTAIGGYAPDFELPGVDGQVHHLIRYLETHRAIGVVFMCNHCPYVHLYLDRLKHIQHYFQGQNFTLIGINSNDAEQYPDDSFDNMKQFAAAQALNFPYLRDVTQEVAQSFGATKTPQVFLLNQAGVLCYSGTIDDNPDAANGVKKNYFQDAIAQVLTNQPIVSALTSPIGCSVKWRV